MLDINGLACAFEPSRNKPCAVQRLDIALGCSNNFTPIGFSALEIGHIFHIVPEVKVATAV